MKKILSLCAMSVLGIGFTTGCFFVDSTVDECDANYFNEYCSGNSKVECIHGDIFHTDCGMGYTCVKHNALQDIAECVPDGIPCDPLTFREYCAGNKAIHCINGYEASVDCGYDVCTEVQPYIAECLPPVTYCDPATFDEYCESNTPVWCRDGVVAYADYHCGSNVCVTFLDTHNVADCAIPEFDEYGGDICDNYYDGGITLSRCINGVTYRYVCSETTGPDDYWRAVESYTCDYGCDYDEIDCAW